MVFMFDTICDDIIEIIINEKNEIVKKNNKKKHTIFLNPVLWDIKMLFYGPPYHGDEDDTPIDLYYGYLYSNEYDENDNVIDVIDDQMYDFYDDEAHIKIKYKKLKIHRGDIGLYCDPTYREINIHHIPMEYAYKSIEKHDLHAELWEKLKINLSSHNL